MSDKKIVNIQLTKTKSVAAVEIGKMSMLMRTA